MKYTNYLEKGKNLFLTGYFKLRFNKQEFEFKVEKIILLESIKQNLTKQVIVDIEARHLKEDMVRFFEKNVKKYPGRSGLKFNIREPKTNCKVSLYTMENGFEMNDEMAAFLQDLPELEVQVVTA
jgi:DNA polymerase-3 subunit alpha